MTDNWSVGSVYDLIALAGILLWRPLIIQGHICCFSHTILGVLVICLGCFGFPCMFGWNYVRKPDVAPAELRTWTLSTWILPPDWTRAVYFNGACFKSLSLSKYVICRLIWSPFTRETWYVSIRLNQLNGAIKLPTMQPPDCCSRACATKKELRNTNGCRQRV